MSHLVVGIAPDSTEANLAETALGTGPDYGSFQGLSGKVSIRGGLRLVVECPTVSDAEAVRRLLRSRGWNAASRGPRVSAAEVLASGEPLLMLAYASGRLDGQGV